MYWKINLKQIYYLVFYILFLVKLIIEASMLMNKERNCIKILICSLNIKI